MYTYIHTYICIYTYPRTALLSRRPLPAHHQSDALSPLHPTSYTLHPVPCTLHPTPYTLHPTPYTLHPTTVRLAGGRGAGAAGG